MKHLSSLIHLLSSIILLMVTKHIFAERHRLRVYTTNTQRDSFASKWLKVSSFPVRGFCSYVDRSVCIYVCTCVCMHVCVCVCVNYTTIQLCIKYNFYFRLSPVEFGWAKQIIVRACLCPCPCVCARVCICLCVRVSVFVRVHLMCTFVMFLAVPRSTRNDCYIQNIVDNSHSGQ